MPKRPVRARRERSPGETPSPCMQVRLARDRRASPDFQDVDGADACFLQLLQFAGHAAPVGESVQPYPVGGRRASQGGSAKRDTSASARSCRAASKAPPAMRNSRRFNWVSAMASLLAFFESSYYKVAILACLARFLVFLRVFVSCGICIDRL